MNVAKKKAKKTSPKGKKSMEMLLVGSKVRQAIKDLGCNFGGDALDGLNGIVHTYVEQAAKRADSNGRKTVRAHDFWIM